MNLSYTIHGYKILHFIVLNFTQLVYSAAALS